MLALPRSQSFTTKYGHDVHSYIVGTKRKEKKKERKKDIEPAAKKKIQHSVGSGGQTINVQINISFRVASLWAYCPIQFWRGLGILLLTVADSYAYTISAPRMYNIVGKERVKALRSESMAGRMRSPPAATSCEGC